MLKLWSGRQARRWTTPATGAARPVQPRLGRGTGIRRCHRLVRADRSRRMHATYGSPGLDTDSTTRSAGSESHSIPALGNRAPDRVSTTVDGSDQRHDERRVTPRGRSRTLFARLADCSRSVSASISITTVSSRICSCSIGADHLKVGAAGVDDDPSDHARAASEPRHLWQRLPKAVGRSPTSRLSRIRPIATPTAAPATPDHGADKPFSPLLTFPSHSDSNGHGRGDKALLERDALRAYRAPHGLELPMGLVTDNEFNSTQHLVQRGATALSGRSSTTTARPTPPGSGSSGKGGGAAANAVMTGTDRPRTSAAARHERLRNRGRSRAYRASRRSARAAWTACGMYSGSTARRGRNEEEWLRHRRRLRVERAAAKPRHRGLESGAGVSAGSAATGRRARRTIASTQSGGKKLGQSPAYIGVDLRPPARPTCSRRRVPFR